MGYGEEQSLLYAAIVMDSSPSGQQSNIHSPLLVDGVSTNSQVDHIIIILGTCLHKFTLRLLRNVWKFRGFINFGDDSIRWPS